MKTTNERENRFNAFNYSGATETLIFYGTHESMINRPNSENPNGRGRRDVIARLPLVQVFYLSERRVICMNPAAYRWWLKYRCGIVAVAIVHILLHLQAIPKSLISRIYKSPLKTYRQIVRELKNLTTLKAAEKGRGSSSTLRYSLLWPNLLLLVHSSQNCYLFQ